MNDPAIKTTPFPHQAALYAAHADSPFFGLLHEMGLGKSKIIIDVASHLFLTGRVSGLIILAPNEVYSEWVRELLPTHMAAPYVNLLFRSGSKGEKAKMRRLLFLHPDEWKGKLRVLVMSYDGLKTDHGCALARDFALLYKCMIVADESTALSNPSTKTAKTAKEIRSYCHFAWLATGTPIAQSPFQFHSQIEFLCPSFWANHGMKSISAFKTQFGVYEQRRAGQRVFSVVTGYQRMDKLTALIKPFTHRLLKEDSSVRLPPKMYRTITFQLEETQRRVYDDLRETYVAELDAAGGVVEAPLAIVRLTRLQQIACGFVTAEETIPSAQMDIFEESDLSTWIGGDAAYASAMAEDTMFDKAIDAGLLHDNGELANETTTWANAPIEPRRVQKKIVDVVEPSRNPRLKLLLALIEECSHKVIVWCRFKPDVRVIADTLGDIAVRYDGGVSRHDREINIARFKDRGDSARVLVANTQSISRGVTLTIAKTMIYYSNSFAPERRLQSEDRAHRIGQDSSVLIIDLVAEDTVDEKLIESLRKKYDVSASVLGDRYREWLQPVRRSEE
jgi:SNF2 family DNA or RNA helicase